MLQTVMVAMLQTVMVAIQQRSGEISLSEVLIRGGSY